MKVFTEKEAERFLNDKGFKIVKTAFAQNKEELKSISKKIKFPWVMKVNSKVIVHKKSSGGVLIGIDSMEKAEQSLSELSKLNGFESAIIQPMLKGHELIVGIKKTPEFGPVIMVGKGGSNVEKEKDVSFRVIPIKKKDVSSMIKELGFYSVLKENKVKIKEIEKVLLKVSRLAEKNHDIVELDINPLIVNSKKAEVVDARVVFED